MFTNELRDLLIKVITSWQVIVVTLVILLYIAMVNYLSRTHYRRRDSSNPRPIRPKRAKPEPVEEADDSELGLED